MKNLEAVLAAAGLTFAHVVRCSIFLDRPGRFREGERGVRALFPRAPPARATVQVAALPRGARVEIDAIAVG